MSPAAANGQMAVRLPHRSVVVLVGDGPAGDDRAAGFAKSLRDLSVEVIYLGREEIAERIVVAVEEASADAVEVCLAGGGGVPVIRELLRALVRAGRRDVSIVVHRIQ
jgi:methylmalonyl-CoA mutase cobalamin-binding domain/chain